jgi:hypothetical protein
LPIALRKGRRISGVIVPVKNAREAAVVNGLMMAWKTKMYDFSMAYGN